MSLRIIIKYSSKTNSLKACSVPNFLVGEREVLTEGKILLLGCENKALRGYGLHSRKKVIHNKSLIFIFTFLKQKKIFST